VYKYVATLYEPDEKWSLWKLRPRTKNNIKMDMKDVRFDVFWIYLPRHMDRLRDFVIKLMNLSI
jgi:hypothetical protein